MTRDQLIAQADKLCAGVHLIAWFAVAISWTVNWRLNGPSPSGPLFNIAYRFIGRVDYLVRATIYDLSVKIGQAATAWFSADLGASFTVAFACLILLAGTLQWFLLGKLVQWITARKGVALGSAVIGAYAIWIGVSVFLWVAA
jgi:hypothetical protein